MAAPTNSLITRDVPFLESPEWIVDAMLEMAEIGEGDVVYDLGSGDGRVVIEAAKRYGVRGVGIEIDDKLVEFSRAAAQQAGVAERVRFIESDIFEADFREASVVMIYLYEKVNEKLKPHLQQQLAPGTRVVCHKFGIKGWRPVKEEKLAGRKLFLYVIPPHG